MSIEEIIKMAHNYGCLYEGTLNEEYSEETLLKDLKKELTLTDVGSSEVALKAFVEEFVEAWEDGMGGDTDLYKKAKSLL